MLSPTIRLKRPRDLLGKHVFRALLVERERFEPHDNYGIKTSPVLWAKVFLRVYRDSPANDADPRYDPLFKKGYALLQRMLE
jgi:hypothetical protein